MELTSSAIGTLNDYAAAHMPRQKSMANAIKKERELLFSKPQPKAVRKSRKVVDGNDVSIDYFIKNSRAFHFAYGYPRTATHDIKIFMLYISRMFNLELEDLLGKNRKAPKPQARKMIAFFLYYYFGMQQEVIANILQKERSTITTHIPDFIQELEIYASSRDLAIKADSYLFNLLKRRKKNAL